MSRRYLIFTLLFPLFLLVSGFAMPPQQTPEKAAQEAAESWLRLIDAGKYAESWDELAEAAKAKVSKASWVKLHNDTATPSDAGEGKTRKLMSSQSVSTLMSMADKAGVDVQYNNSPDSHRSVIELVELVQEPERGWRVVFYLKLANTFLYDPLPQSGSREGAILDPRLRPAQNVAVDQRPVPLNAPKPNYTEEARHNKVEGTVIARVLVGEDGEVKQVKITRGLPYGLDEQAIRAAYELRFKPAMKDGKPIAFWVSVSLEFKLR